MNPKVRSVINFFHANLHRQIRMAEIAALAGLSHSRVVNLFKAETGQSPVQYLKALRLEKARGFLETTGLQIKQVRLAVGYQDHRNFFRDFKKQFGLTPSEYRARCLAAALTENGLAKK